MKRFVSLLSYEFRIFEVTLLLTILDPNLTSKEQDEEVDMKAGIKKVFF